MTRDLPALSDWLASGGVTIVAMESTGSYWKPVFHILGSRLMVVLINAHHVEQVPGRKTGVKDSEWIAELLQHGLLRPSFVPPRPTRELRDLTRRRTRLVGENTAVANLVGKVLEDANIKLDSVASNGPRWCKRPGRRHGPRGHTWPRSSGAPPRPTVASARRWLWHIRFL